MSRERNRDKRRSSNSSISSSSRSRSRSRTRSRSSRSRGSRSSERESKEKLYRNVYYKNKSYAGSDSRIFRDTNSSDPRAIAARLFIGNLATDRITREEVIDIFMKYGRVTGLSLRYFPIVCVSY